VVKNKKIIYYYYYYDRRIKHIIGHRQRATRYSYLCLRRAKNTYCLPDIVIKSPCVPVNFSMGLQLNIV
jgi:hypothetical protein